MKTRRHVLALLGATAVAGCAGRATDQPAANETADEPAADGETVTDAVDDPHLDWAYGEDQQILEQVQDEVDLDPVKNILEGDAEIHEKVGEAMLEANTQYTQNQGYEHRHKTAVTTVQQAIQDLDLDITLTTFAGNTPTPKYPGTGLDYSKVWVNNSDKDVRVALNPENRSPNYHIEGEQPEGDIQEILKNLINPEAVGARAAHDFENQKNALEFYRASGQEYSDEKVEKGYGSWIQRFENYLWGEGIPVPSTIEDWKDLHQGFESGSDMIRELNKAYREAGYNGETAQFTIENRSVTMSDVPDNYNIAKDGVPGNPAA